MWILNELKNDLENTNVNNIYYMFHEQVNQERLNYLKKMTDFELESLCRDNKESTNQDGKPYNYNWIIKGIKEMNSKQSIRYKYAKMRRTGRLYPTTFGVQCLPNNIRTFLTENIYYDYDLVNAHFQILLKLCYKHNLPHKYIKQYVEDRNSVLEKNHLKKIQMIILLYTDTIKNIHTPYINSLALEIATVRNELISIYNPETRNVKNPLSSRLCQILLEHENEIIQKVLLHFKCKEAVLMFDGLMLPNKIDIEELNKLTGYQWIMKTHINTIEMEEDILEREGTDYESIKSQFEQNNFMCRNPMCFYRFIDNEWVETSKADIELDTMDLIANEKPFFSQWLKDKNKRKYNRVVWTPTLGIEKELNGNFNTFEPFVYQPSGSQLASVNVNEAVPLFKMLLSILSNNVERQTDFLTKYLAHLIKKPWENPEIAVVMKGMEGSGKDTLLYILDKLLGNNYVYCEQDINNILGNFNGLRSKKLLMGLNEMCGNDGVRFRESLKHCITSKTMLINEKYGKQRTETNYTRFMIFSNGLTPIQVSRGMARRFMVMDTSSEKCGSQHKQWWTRFYNTIDKKDSLQAIFDYLYSIDIEGWNPSAFVDTESKTKLSILNNNPVYQFLRDIIQENKLNMIEVKGQAYRFSHWSTLHDLFECSHYADNPIKMLHFKKLILSLDGVSVKRRGKVEGVAIEEAKVLEQLGLRLEAVEEI